MTNPDPDIDHQFDEPDPTADSDESESDDLNERYADHTSESKFGNE